MDDVKPPKMTVVYINLWYLVEEYENDDIAVAAAGDDGGGGGAGCKLSMNF